MGVRAHTRDIAFDEGDKPYKYFNVMKYKSNLVKKDYLVKKYCLRSVQ